jgi:single-strand DNA-binding protein
MNSGQIIGHLTRDVDLRFTSKGTAVADFSIAWNDHYKDAEGNKAEKVSFFECVAWNGTAENLAKFFHKGDRIALSYKLVQETWEDRESGQKREKVKLTVEGFDFMQVKRDDTPTQQQPPPRQPQPRAAAAAPRDAGGGWEDPNESIPF